nr:hypothetical protein [Tanacetum cinerariifolium]
MYNDNISTHPLHVYCTTIANYHREEEDQEGNDSSEIETLTYHVLATYALFLRSFATFDMSIIVIMYNDNISTHPLHVYCTTIANYHREEEDQEGNDSSVIEILTYHVLATYGLFLRSFATFDTSIIVIIYNDNISTPPLNVQCTTITYRLIRCTSIVRR